MRPSILTACVFLALPAHAEWSMGFDYDFDANTKPWAEIEAQLPAAPNRATLLPLDVSPASRHLHYVDPVSISAGGDGVVRYTVLIRTAGGAENVSHEGMRCSTGERKTYAFGRPDGVWARNKYARWEPIDSRGAASYHRELFFHYFCTVDGAADMGVIRRALQQGGIRRGGD